MIYEVDNALLQSRVFHSLVENGVMTREEADDMRDNIFENDIAIAYKDRDDRFIGIMIVGIDDNLIWEGGNRAAVVRDLRTCRDNSRYVFFELLARARVWARGNNIKNIYMIAKNDAKYYINKMRFDYVATILKREA